jgi:hypothetical protein
VDLRLLGAAGADDGLLDQPWRIFADVDARPCRAHQHDAARIANELQGKLGVSGLGGAAPVPRGGAASDAMSALANLGFKPAEASAAVNAAQDELGPQATLDALVRLALKKAAK